MQRVKETTETVGGTVVSFSCPICGNEETGVIEGGGKSKHACRTENIAYPLLPVVSLAGASLSELSTAEKVEMQLRSVDYAHPYVQRYRAPSQEVLHAVHGMVSSNLVGFWGIVNVLFIAAAFPMALQTNTLLFGAYMLNVLALSIGLVATWGISQSVRLAADYVRQEGIEESVWWFIACIGNYYGEDPYRLWFWELNYFYPSSDSP